LLIATPFGLAIVDNVENDTLTTKAVANAKVEPHALPVCKGKQMQGWELGG